MPASDVTWDQSAWSDLPYHSLRTNFPPGQSPRALPRTQRDLDYEAVRQIMVARHGYSGAFARTTTLLNAGRHRRLELALQRATGLTYEEADRIGDLHTYGVAGDPYRWDD